MRRPHERTRWALAAVLVAPVTVLSLVSTPGSAAACTGNYGETPIIEKTTDDGVSWAAQTAPELTDGTNDVECPSLRTCYAVGSTFAD